MADKKTNKKTENDLIPQNIPSEEDISKYVEQLGRYEGTPKPPDTTYSDIGEYLNQRGEYKGSPVPSLVIGQDKISEYVNNLEGYTGKQEGSFEGTPVVHTNFKGAIDNEYVNPNLIPIDILDSALNMSPFRKQGSMVIAPGLTADTTLPAIPKPTGYTLVDMHKFQVDRDNKEITLAVYDQDAGSKVKMYITPYWNPSSNFSNCRLDKAISTQNTWITNEWLELTEYYTTTLATVPTNNTMTLTDVLVDTLHYFKGWFIVNNTWTGNRDNRYQYINAYDNSTKTITTLGGLGYTSATYDWQLGDTVELVRFPVRSHYSLDTQYMGNTDNFTAFPTSYIGKLNELRIACGKDNRPLIITDIKERAYFTDSQNVSLNFSTVSSISMILNGQGYAVVPSLSSAFSGGGGTGATASARMFPLMSQIDLSTAGWGGGSGYAVGDIIQLDSGTTVGTNKALAYVETISGGGSTGPIATISQYGDTAIYTAVPTYGTAAEWTWTSLTGSGTGAKIRFDWCVYDIVITNGGSGYTSAPAITIPAATDWTTKVTATATAYLAVNNSTTGDYIGLSYDGLWFDFASIPQTLISSGCTAFNGNTSVTADEIYLNADCSLTTVPTTNCIKFTPIVPGSWRILTSKKKSTVASPTPWQAPQYRSILTDGGEGVIGINYNYNPTYNNNIVDYHIVFVKAVDGLGNIYNFADKTLAEMKTALETSIYTESIRSKFVFTMIGTSSTQFTTYDSTQTLNSEQVVTSTSLGEDDVGLTAFNKFLGCSVEVTSHGTTIPSGSTKKNTMLLSCIVDNRNEVLLSQGTYEPAQGFKVKFNPWFSRRITGFNFYSRSVTTTLSGWLAYFSKVSRYPYFKWLKETSGGDDIYINETPLFATYSTKSMIGDDTAEFSNKYLVIDKANGYNCYKWDYQYNEFYTVFKQVSPAYINLEESGKGLKWIVNTNRYVDQDTTMNYTRAVFVGQTNGRYFISGCKNNVEYEELENDDMIFCNNYAVGVSQYDTFLRNSSISVQLGDKDIIRAMSNYGGYLTAIKDSNSYVLDVNTDDELKYRVVDTMNGRGTTFGNSLGETPYGIVMPTYDGVWLMSPSGVTPIMNYTNSKFNLYKTLFTGASDITTVYYNNYNEVMICMLYPDGGNNLCYIFTYNFAYKFWAYYLYTLTNIKKILGDSSRNVLFVDKATDYGVYKVSETTNTFTWNAQTHNMPYGDRFKQVYASWITILADYTKESNTRGTLTVTPIKDGVDQTAVTFNVDTTLYLKPDGTFVTSSPGTHYITITNTSNNIVQLRVILGAEASITKSSANTYDITVKNTVTTLQEVIDLINGVSSGLSIAGGGTPAVIAFTGPATKQSATFFKASRDDLLLDIPITFGSPANTFAVRISGTLFTRFNLNGIYVWLNTQNRLPNLR